MQRAARQDLRGTALPTPDIHGRDAIEALLAVQGATVVVALLADGTFVDQIEGPAGAAALLQWSSDLVVWTDVGTFTVGESHTDPDGIVEARRFYRLVDPVE